MTVIESIKVLDEWYVLDVARALAMRHTQPVYLWRRDDVLHMRTGDEAPPYGGLHVGTMCSDGQLVPWNGGPLGWERWVPR